MTNSLARDLVEDALTVALGVVSLVFHHTLHLSGTDETFIVTAGVGFLTSKRITKIINSGFSFITRKAASVKTIDPTLEAQLVDTLTRIEAKL